MSFRKDVDEMMQNVQVDYEMTNNIMNNTVRNSGKKYRGFRKKAIVVVTLAMLFILKLSFFQVHRTILFN